MKELFKELIVEFQRKLLAKPSKRELTLKVVPPGVRKAYVFLGMRRSGKTWYLYQLMHDLMSTGVDRTKILYLNFEDDRLSDMQGKNFQDILKAYFELYPDYLVDPDVHFFFDEIHEVEGWEKFVRRLLDQEAMHIYLTGSSSKMLSKEIASSLRGRTMVQEIFPFNFREYLHRLGFAIGKSDKSSSEKIELMHHLQKFLRVGGFPETVGAAPDVHRTLLQGYTSSVIYRDIVDRYGVGNTHALKLLLSHALRNSATSFSLNKMYHIFKSMGYEVSKNSLYEYMGYFEDAYCVFSLPKFDLSVTKSAYGIKKIYAIDQGLITAFTIASDFDLASQLETAVFAYLRAYSSDVFYYKTIDGKEVDFVLLLADQTMHLVQVSLTIKDPRTRKRELEALAQGMKELNVPKGLIVTLDESEVIESPHGLIEVIPAWQLFLKKQLDEPTDKGS